MNIGTIIFPVIWISICIYFLIRNELVYKLRGKINTEVRNLKDAGKAIKIYKKFDGMTYNQMLFSYKSITRLEKEWRKMIGLK